MSGDSKSGRLPIVVDKDGPVRVMTLNRPEVLNAFDGEMIAAFVQALAELSVDRGARAVVLTGAGRAFSAGGSLDELEKYINDRVERSEEMRRSRRLFDEMLTFHLPLIAAVNGPAVGLGCTIVTGSDLVYMSEDTYLADPHITVALVAGDGGAITWPACTSLLVAKRFLLTGDRMPAADAVRLGLANEAVPAGELLPAAVAMAHKIAKLPAQAVQETKLLLNQGMRQASVATLAYGLAAESQSHDTQDIKDVLDGWRNRRTAKAGNPT